MPVKLPAMRLFMFAGDLSADRIGENIIDSLAKSTSHLECYGIGGPAMRKAGLKPIIDNPNLSHIGILQSIKHGFSASRQIAKIRQSLKDFDGDALITIDMASISSALASDAQAKSLPAFHVVAPTVWAWRSYRAPRFARLYKGIYCIFPFEPPYFSRHRGHAIFVGHPQAQLLKAHHGSRDGGLLLMPGSRSQEIDSLLPIYLEALASIDARDRPSPLSVAAVKHQHDRIANLVTASGLPIQLIGENDRYAAMKSADFAVACMGTGTLELALLGTPHISTYKVDLLTQWMWTIMNRTKYLHVVNKMANRALIPEIYQDNCTPQTVAAYIRHFTNISVPLAQQKSCAPFVTRLRHPEQRTHGEIIAEDIQRVLAK